MNMFDDIKEKVNSLPLFECIDILKRLYDKGDNELSSILETHDDGRIRDLLANTAFVDIFESLLKYYRKQYLLVHPGSDQKDIDATFRRSIHELWSLNKEKALDTSKW